MDAPVAAAASAAGCGEDVRTHASPDQRPAGCPEIAVGAAAAGAAAAAQTDVGFCGLLMQGDALVKDAAVKDTAAIDGDMVHAGIDAAAGVTGGAGAADGVDAGSQQSQVITALWSRLDIPNMLRHSTSV